MESLTSIRSIHTSSNTQSLPVQLLLFLCGFQFSYLLFGWLLASILTSSIQNGFKLSLGILFLVASILAMDGKVDPLRLPLVESAWMTGVSFALLLSFNPCVVPFMAALLSLADTRSTLLSLMCFAQGLITPALLVVAAGSRLLSWLEQSAFRIEKIKPLTHGLLALSGLYLLLAPIYTLSLTDLLVALVGLCAALTLIHSASAKPAGATSSCRILPDGQLSCQLPNTTGKRVSSVHMARRRRWMIGVAVTLMVLLGVAAFSLEHDRYTHAAADDLMNTGSGSQSAHVETVLPVDTVLDLPSPPRIRQLKRRLNVPTNPDQEETDEQLLHPTDQSVDVVPVPSIDMSSDHVNVHPADVSVRLSPTDIAALESVAAEVAAMSAAGQTIDTATCIDLSQLPACLQCHFVLGLYRTFAIGVALLAALQERISLNLFTRHISTYSRRWIQSLRSKFKPLPPSHRVTTLI
jgi:hypothetical protein